MQQQSLDSKSYHRIVELWHHLGLKGPPKAIRNGQGPLQLEPNRKQRKPGVWGSLVALIFHLKLKNKLLLRGLQERIRNCPGYRGDE